MKNCDVLRMAEVLIPPEAPVKVAEGEEAPSAESLAITRLQKVERLRGMLDATVRLLYPKGLLSDASLAAPVLPLPAEGEFPLPDSLAAAAAFHTAWLFSAESRLQNAYSAALEAYLHSLPAVVEPIIRRH